MRGFRRYAVYWAPEEPLAGAAARWLGWDPARGVAVEQPEVGLPLAEWTAAPRRYGFHGTVKPPFRLATGWGRDRLSAALAGLCARLAPVELGGLGLMRIAGFLALTPRGDETTLRGLRGLRGLRALAAQAVDGLDPARAAPSEEEIARRNPERLSARQRDLLDRWGYPYVMEEFRFHLTLSSNLDAASLDRLQPVAEAWFAPHLPAPFRLDTLCLFGEDDEGRFHLLERHALRG